MPDPKPLIIAFRGLGRPPKPSEPFLDDFGEIDYCPLLDSSRQANCQALAPLDVDAALERLLDKIGPSFLELRRFERREVLLAALAGPAPDEPTEAEVEAWRECAKKAAVMVYQTGSTRLEDELANLMARHAKRRETP